MRTFKLYLAFLAIIFTTNVNAGSFDWAKMLSHGSRGDYPYESKVDRFGNILVAGRATGCMGCLGGYISKYDSSGNAVFIHYISDDMGNSVSSVGVDYNGNIYLTANFIYTDVYLGPNHLTNPNYDWKALIKLNASGIILWYKVIPSVNQTKIAIDSIGNAFVSSGDSLRKFDNLGILNWIVPATGSIIDEAGGNLMLATSSQIKMINKVTGANISNAAVGNCASAAVSTSGEVYYTGSLGTYKLQNGIVIWSLSTLSGSAIDFSNNTLWLGRNLIDPVAQHDSAELMSLNNSGLILNRDTIKNGRILFVNIGNNNRPNVISTWGGMNTPTNSVYSILKPYIVFDDYNIAYGGGGFILSRYNSNTIIKLGFAEPFWDLNAPYNTGVLGTFKVCAGGAPFNVKYKLYDGNFTPGNIVFVELSDVSGSFNNPLTIGVSSTQSSEGTISCQIPNGMTNSYGYVLRIKAINPLVYSVENSGNIDISAPISTISLSGSSNTFCAKKETLSVITTGYYYSWLRNGVPLNVGSQQYVPTLSGTYRCVVSDDMGCTRQSNNQIAVTVKALPNAAINYSGNKEICNSDTLQLAVPLVAGNSYQWYKGVAAISGQTSNAYPTNITGNYKVTVTGSNGCSKTSSVLKLSVYKPSIQAFGPTTFCNGGNVVLGISSGTTNSWQWIKNNVNISGANNQYYVATKTGYYKAATTNSNGCTGVSANIVVTVNCREGEIENEFNTKLQAYPNPINDRVTIEGAAISAEGTIDVFDITGRKVDVDIESIQDGMATLNCSTLNDGIYILNFVKELGTIETIKLIKQ